MKNFSFNVEIWEDGEDTYCFGVSQVVDGQEAFLAGGMGLSVEEAAALASEEIKAVFA